MKKRLLSGLTAFAVAVSMVGLPAVNDLGLHFDIIASAETVDSGTCGENLTWTLNSEGILTISGMGEMSDYSPNNPNSAVSPWLSRDDIKELIINNGVTSIAWGAFGECTSLTNVSIPKSISNIGEYAFKGCSSLTSISISGSVESIGQGTFLDCSNLTSIILPDSLKSIGSGAFLRCTALTNISIPDGVTSIEDIAFGDCIVLNSIIIPNGVTSIGECAFYNCQSLTDITIPNSVKNIGAEAFMNTHLTSITIPKSVTTIGDNAFGYYYHSTLTKVNNFKIYYYRNTAGETYAIENGFDYILLDDNIDDNLDPTVIKTDDIVPANVTEHIKYLEKNGNLIYDYQNSDIYKKVRNLAINDKEVLNYDKIKITKYLWDELSNKGLIGALNISSIEELDEMFENITDSELMAQIIVTELISSAELKAKFVSDGINGINIADDRLLYLLYLNKSLFSMSETDKENIEKLLEMEDKSSKDYISARNLLLNKYFSSDLELSKSDIEATDIVGLITDYDDIDDEYGFIKNGTDPELFDFYDGLKILQFSIDEVSKSNVNANDIRVFYENVFALSSLSYSTQETLEVLKQSVEKMKDTDSNGDILLSKYETAIIEYIDELQNAISGHYQDYFNKKVSERLEEMNNDLVDFIVSEALDKVLMITCCPLAWVANSIPGITLDILMVTYGCFTGASERVSEIKYIYATSVVYEALANEFRNKNGTYGYFPKKLITNKTEYSVDLYETGLLWYKVAADMYAEHCAKYLMMTLNPLGSKQEFESTLNDIKSLEDWFIYVNNIMCHENSLISIDPASKEKLYVISCPVDVAVISNGTVLAEVKDETLYKYVNDPRIRIATFINDNYDGFSKALIVPYDYDVKIAGYDDGKMNLMKVVIENGKITDIATFEDIPVSDNVQYTEVNKNDKLVEIDGIDSNGNVVSENSRTVSGKDISEARIHLSSNKYSFTGNSVTPKVKVVYRHKTLVEGKDYELSYENSINPGKATVKITGIGDLSGTVTRDYLITPAKVKLNEVKSETDGTLYVSWINDGMADGYEILLYSSRSRGYSSTISRFTIDGTESETTINDLIAGNRYTVYVRAYKLIDGTPVYGKFGASKSVTIKNNDYGYGFGNRFGWGFGFGHGFGYGFGYNPYFNYGSYGYNNYYSRPYATTFRSRRTIPPFYFWF